MNHIWVKARDTGFWHVADATYPNTAHTACGKQHLVVSIFQTARPSFEMGDWRPDFCSDCAARSASQEGGKP